MPDGSLGFIRVLGQEHPVLSSGLRIVTRKAQSGDWKYLFLFASNAPVDSLDTAGFSIDCLGLRPEVTLERIGGGGRIHTSWEGCEEDDTLSTDGESVEASTFSIPGSDGSSELCMFDRLRADIVPVKGDCLRVCMTGSIYRLSGDFDHRELIEFSADFEATAREEEEGD